MVDFISVPVNCMHVMSLAMHFASSSQHLNSDMKHKAQTNLERSITYCVSHQIFT